MPVAIFSISQIATMLGMFMLLPLILPLSSLQPMPEESVVISMDPALTLVISLIAIISVIFFPIPQFTPLPEEYLVISQVLALVISPIAIIPGVFSHPPPSHPPPSLIAGGSAAISMSMVIAILSLFLIVIVPGKLLFPHLPITLVPVGSAA